MLQHHHDSLLHHQSMRVYARVGVFLSSGDIAAVRRYPAIGVFLSFSHDAIVSNCGHYAMSASHESVVSHGTVAKLHHRPAAMYDRYPTGESMHRGRRALTNKEA